jgi:hypothetical protein
MLQAMMSFSASAFPAASSDENQLLGATINYLQRELPAASNVMSFLLQVMSQESLLLHK